MAKQCDVARLSGSGFYAWRGRPLSRRAREDVEISQEIRVIHAVSRGTYGAPRVHAELAADGMHVGTKRVARLMRLLGLQAASRRPFVATTVRHRDARPATSLVESNFTAASRDQLWVADITYVPTAPGLLFLAVVLDACSRKFVGWRLADHLRAEFVVEVLETARAQRRPDGVIHHSDQRTQYTSIAFGPRCRAAKVRPSMGSAGDAYDNAMAESFVASLECDLPARHCLRNKAETRMAIFEWIEGWYNPRRRHSALGYLSPDDFEARAEDALMTANV